MTDRNHWGLRGAVRSCRLQRTWYSRGCGTDVCETEERGNSSVIEFRLDGLIARQWHQYANGSDESLTYDYGGLGRLVAVRGDIIQLHEYDPAGRLMRVIARSANGGDRIVESYNYDAAGRKKKTFYADGVSDFWAEGTDISFSAPGTAYVTTLYNERDQPIQSLFHDQSDRLLRRVELTYDHAGRLVEEALMAVEDVVPAEMSSTLNEAQLRTFRGLLGGSERLRRRHQYDERGYRVESRSQTGPLADDFKTMTYNDYGDPVGEICELHSREYGIDDQGRLSESPMSESSIRSEARFHYDYDARGNWVTMTVEGRHGTDQDFALSSVERRTLEYFE